MNLEREAATLRVQSAGDLQSRAHTDRGLLDDRQPQPGTRGFVTSDTAIESIKDPRPVALGNARPIVGYREPHDTG